MVSIKFRPKLFFSAPPPLYLSLSLSLSFFLSISFLHSNLICFFLFFDLFFSLSEQSMMWFSHESTPTHTHTHTYTHTNAQKKNTHTHANTHIHIQDYVTIKDRNPYLYKNCVLSFIYIFFSMSIFTQISIHLISNYMHKIGNTHDNQKPTIQNLSYVCMFIWFQVLRILLKYIIFFPKYIYLIKQTFSHTHTN